MGRRAGVTDPTLAPAARGNRSGAYAPLMTDRPAGVRLQRYLADAGVAARRACELLIEEGRVEVNGRVVTRLPVFVDPDADRVRVDGRPVKKPQRRLYLMLHKPARTLATTASAGEASARTVMDLIDYPSDARLFPVGRLDFDTTGLLLITNDGEFANRLTHPRFGIKKTYLAVVKGTPDPIAMARLSTQIRRHDKRRAVEEAREKGVRVRTLLDAAKSRPKTAPLVRLVRSEGGKSLLEITLLEAKNRQLEDVLKTIGCPVKKLSRIAVGPVQLKGLQVGRWRELTREELHALRKATRQAKKPAADLSAKPAGARP